MSEKENCCDLKNRKCPVDDWDVVGWIVPSKSEKALKIIINCVSEDGKKNKTLGVFFPKQISDLYSRKINAIPIKYKKPKEIQNKNKNESELSDETVNKIDSARERIKETGGVSESKAKELLNLKGGN